MSEYLQRIIDTLERIEAEEAQSLSQAARLVAKTIEEDGLILVFGCGHSHLPGLDAISFGPNLADIHSPEEALDLASMERFWRKLVALLK